MRMRVRVGREGGEQQEEKEREVGKQGGQTMLTPRIKKMPPLVATSPSPWLIAHAELLGSKCPNLFLVSEVGRNQQAAPNSGVRPLGF